MNHGNMLHNNPSLFCFEIISVTRKIYQRKNMFCKKKKKRSYYHDKNPLKKVFSGET